MESKYTSKTAKSMHLLQKFIEMQMKTKNLINQIKYKNKFL